jgi:copper(I)-binding protein
MKSILRVSLAIASLTLAGSALAQVDVSQAWVRATVAQQKATGAFLQLKAKRDSRLVEAHSKVAGVVEVHEMAMDGSTMKMRAVPALELPAGQLVELKPGGLHVMLMDLKQPIKAGDKLALTLVFEDKASKQRESVEVQAEARQLGMPAH